jgi:DNA-binding transcriptional MocR family regulator
MSVSDEEIRRVVYGRVVETGRLPHSRDVAKELSLSDEDVLAAFRRLNERRLLALAPGTGQIVMAPPFSAVPTPYLVRSGGKSYFANCVWDAYGIAAALHADAVIDASCACCDEPMRLDVRGGGPVPRDGVAHFAVPAARWWEDIAYT